MRELYDAHVGGYPSPAASDTRPRRGYEAENRTPVASAR